jgi:hypothetical protein
MIGDTTIGDTLDVTILRTNTVGIVVALLRRCEAKLHWKSNLRADVHSVIDARDSAIRTSFKSASKGEKCKS